MPARGHYKLTQRTCVQWPTGHRQPNGSSVSLFSALLRETIFARLLASSLAGAGHRNRGPGCGAPRDPEKVSAFLPPFAMVGRWQAVRPGVTIASSYFRVLLLRLLRLVCLSRFVPAASEAFAPGVKQAPPTTFPHMYTNSDGHLRRATRRSGACSEVIPERVLATFAATVCRSE